MVADDLTKKTSGQRIRDMAVSSMLDMVEDNPTEDPTTEEVDEAAREIPLLREEDEHRRNADTVMIQISDDSSVASEAPQPRRFARMNRGGKEPGRIRRQAMK